MDGFRKPFEYEEEKRGFIHVFIIMLLVLDTQLTLSYIAQVYGTYKHLPILRMGYMAIGILFFLFILTTIVICSKMKKGMVKLSKIYLIVRTVFLICGVGLVYMNARNNENLIGNGSQRYRTVGDMVLGVFILPLASILVFSIGWYLYFSLSKRCKELRKKTSNG